MEIMALYIDRRENDLHTHRTLRSRIKMTGQFWSFSTISNSTNWTSSNFTAIQFQLCNNRVSRVSPEQVRQQTDRIENRENRKKTYVFLSLSDVVISRKETDRVDVQFFTLYITHAIPQTQHTAYIYRMRRRRRVLISNSSYNYVLTLLEFTSYFTCIWTCDNCNRLIIP